MMMVTTWDMSVPHDHSYKARCQLALNGGYEWRIFSAKLTAYVSHFRLCISRHLIRVTGCFGVRSLQENYRYKLGRSARFLLGVRHQAPCCCQSNSVTSPETAQKAPRNPNKIFNCQFVIDDGAIVTNGTNGEIGLVKI